MVAGFGSRRGGGGGGSDCVYGVRGWRLFVNIELLVVDSNARRQRRRSVCVRHVRLGGVDAARDARGEEEDEQVHEKSDQGGVEREAELDEVEQPRVVLIDLDCGCGGGRRNRVLADTIRRRHRFDCVVGQVSEAIGRRRRRRRARGGGYGRRDERVAHQVERVDVEANGEEARGHRDEHEDGEEAERDAHASVASSAQ